MKLIKASSGNRFLAYFIDSIIISIIVSVLSAIVGIILDTDSNALLYSQEQFINSLADYLLCLESGMSYDVSQIFINLEVYLKYWVLEFTIQSILFLVVAIIYFVVIPLSWDKQTIGRVVAKVKVVNKENEPVTTKNLIFREIICGFLLYRLLGSTGIFIATWILSSVDRRSLADYIGKTNLVSTVERLQGVEEEFTFKENDDDSNDSEYTIL